MQNSLNIHRVLHAIFRTSAETRPLSRPRLALRLRLPTAEVAEALEVLSDRGLVDATRLRLTLSGLAVAAAFAGRALPETAGGSRRRRRAA